jgi:hypothetical protein
LKIEKIPIVIRLKFQDEGVVLIADFFEYSIERKDYDADFFHIGIEIDPTHDIFSLFVLYQL